MAKADSEKKRASGLWETVKTIFWALLIAGAFRTILFQPFSIPSGSMKPELLIGDYLFVSKFAYGYSHYSLPFEPDWFEGRIWGAMPERGDVIVFKHPMHDACDRPVLHRVGGFLLSILGQPQEPSDCIDYVKRVVGLPGDEIQLRGGILHINGEPVPTERIEDFAEPRIALGNPRRFPRCINGPVPPGGTCLKEQYVETLPNGRTHRFLNIRGEVGLPPASTRRSSDNTPVFTVPEGQLFFLGDNRDNSYDSRFPSELGFVPVENLIGRADVIAFSSAGSLLAFWNWRLDRFFESIE